MVSGLEVKQPSAEETFEAYRGDGSRRQYTPMTPAAGAKLRIALSDPAGYRPSQRTRDAVNVALLMGMPLLIAGEPGSGKTQLGYAVAHELGLDAPKLFVTKSASQARDLFYRYDAIRHFHAAQTGRPQVEPFLHLEALGQAIIAGLPADERPKITSEQADSAQRRSLVIVDEIDKAPRDFPNDLLHEFDQLRFRIPELGGFESPEVPDEFRPILFVTTNSEQLLPDAFLRRCAFLHLESPRGAALSELIERRFRHVLSTHHPLVESIVDIFDAVRDRGQLERPPSSAEILEFLAAALSAGVDPALPLDQQTKIAEAYLPLLAKTPADAAILMAEVATTA